MTVYRPDPTNVVEHKIIYHRRGGYEEPAWRTECVCGWMSRIYPSIGPAMSAAKEHKETVR